MKHFEQWSVLSKHLKKGSFFFVDLAFAESVLKKLGSSEEEHAALLATLFAMSRLGHLALDISEEALISSLKLLEINDLEDFAILLLRGVETFPKQTDAWVCRFNNYFYLQKNWVCESEILFHLNRLGTSQPALPMTGSCPSSNLNEAQKKAVLMGMQNSLSLLTGGPGTGKTFTAAELVKSCLLALSPEQKEHFRIILAAPTGKAVAQLEGNLRKAVGETANIRSGTLHSILGIKSYYQENTVQPLFADLILVDECSMIDSKIFSQLLASVQTGARLILIGDKDQLPPVEAGSIFADLLDLEIYTENDSRIGPGLRQSPGVEIPVSGSYVRDIDPLTGTQPRELSRSPGSILESFSVYPATQLTECLRSESLEILSLAKLIKMGNAAEVLALLSSQAGIDWIDLEEEKKSVSQIYSELWSRCKDRFPPFFLQKPSPEQVLGRLGEFSILSCMRQGSLGVDAVNGYFLSQYLKQIPQDAWWVAPIMITRNDHELQLFNGDLGFVVRQMGNDFSLREFQIDDYILFYDRIPKMIQESARGCVKAPAVEFPQVGPYYEHKTHLRESQPRGFDAAPDRFLNHFRYKSGFRQIPALALTSFEYSYCQSVHKSQGSEYNEVLILVPSGSQAFGREVLYTALTRAKNKVSLAGSQTVLQQSISSSSRKASGLTARLKICI